MPAKAAEGKAVKSTIGAALRSRYLDVVASIYIYNEYRGYTSLDRVLAAVRRHCPDDPAFIAAVVRHRSDERKHYLMFKRWFERQGRMPLALDRSYGQIDWIIRFAFGCSIDEIDTDEVLAEPGGFERLCRVIVLTEERGLAQVEALLNNQAIMADPVLARIFRIVHKDEPDHFLPYRAWLERQGKPVAAWRERLADACIHKVLLWRKLPALFLDSGARRLEHWPDDGEGEPG